MESPHHGLYCRYIVLKIGIDGDQHVTRNGEQPCEDCILLAEIPRELYSMDPRVFACESLDNSPSTVNGVVINKID
jgi:hypothetical protein